MVGDEVLEVVVVVVVVVVVYLGSKGGFSYMECCKRFEPRIVF